jgi:hypothetical protein
VNYRQHQSNFRITVPALICVTTVVVLAIAASIETPSVDGQTNAKLERPLYKVDLEIDFDHLSYSGVERLRWLNDDDKPTSVLYFHLYPNIRVPEQQSSPTAAANLTAEPDEPQMDIVSVRSAASESSLSFGLEDQGTILRVNLREPVLPDGITDIEIKFKGMVPDIDPDETSLTTHVVKQVSAALRSEREMRRARDINFRCRGIMLLATSYPILVVRDGDEWRRRIEPSVGDVVFGEVADYEVTITAPGVDVFTSAPEVTRSDKQARTFNGSALREFAILVGKGLRSEHTEINGVKITSIFQADHERVGKRALTVASNAFRVFTTAFGALPYKSITVAEAPLVAGLGSTEFSGFNVIASAFYVDFDSPAVRNLPELIREQRPSVEESLEWTVGYLVANQWWGSAVGNDPAREPVLDEALSCWSSLLYYRSTYGKEKAAAVLDDQVRGVYRLYRTFGGDDMFANRPSRDYRNTFQYAAIVTAKGALMFVELQDTLGEDKVLAALKKYYEANLFEIAQLDDLRSALVAEAPVEQRRMVGRTFTRWLSSKRGDEDIGPPDSQLAETLGISPPASSQNRAGDKNAFTALAGVGKFFWRQMTRIR